MEFDWLNPSFDLKAPFFPKEIEESFEDPFCIRLAPDAKQFAEKSRYFCLGKTLSGRGILTVYRSNGNQTRAICSRPFSQEEEHFYERKKQESL